MIANPLVTPSPPKHATAVGVACGAGAAFCWALGFVAARHGINVGVSPFVLALHRYFWPGLALLPFVVTNGFRDLGGIGWGRGFVSGAVRRASARAVKLSRLRLRPARPRRRHSALMRGTGRHAAGAVGAEGAAAGTPHRRRGSPWSSGLCIIGTEALRTIGAHGIGGDLLFVAAGGFFATFGMLVRLWRVAAMRAVAITSVLSLVAVPILLFRFDNLLAAGFAENLLQAVIQGALAGAGSDLSVHARRRAARRLARRFVSLAGSAVRAVARLSRARRGAERLAARGPRHRRSSASG